MLNKKHTKFLVLYVFSKYDNIDRLKEFVKSYKKYNLGYPHDLLICYKFFYFLYLVFSFQKNQIINFMLVQQQLNLKKRKM